MAGDSERPQGVDDAPSVGVYSKFVATIRPVEQTQISLLLTLGTMSPDRVVLVPVVEWHLREEAAPDADGSAAPGTTLYYLPLENALFVLEAMCHDLSRVSSQLAAISEGRIRPAPELVATYDEYIASAQEALQECRERLKAIG